MNDFFNPDNRIMRALSRLFDLMIVNLLTVLLCVPVITAGAAFASMHSLLIQMAENREGYIVKTFFSKFRENFKQATIVWLVFLAFGVFLFIDLQVVNSMSSGTANVMRMVFIVIGFLLIFIGQYMFPLIARYENTLSGHLDTAVKLAIGFFPKSLAMLVIHIAVIALAYRYFAYVLPILLLFGFSGTAYTCTQLYMTIFHKIEEKSGGGGDDEGDGSGTDDGNRVPENVASEIEARRIPGRDTPDGE